MTRSPKPRPSRKPKPVVAWGAIDPQTGRIAIGVVTGRLAIYLDRYAARQWNGKSKVRRVRISVLP